MTSPKASQIIKDFPNWVAYASGNKEIQALNVKSIAQLTQASLCYASSLEQIKKAIDARAAIVIFSDSIELNDISSASTCLLKTSNLHMAMAKVNSHYFASPPPTSQKISVTAYVDPSVKLPQNIFIGPGAIIEENVHLSENISIHANAVIEQKAQIGPNTIISSNAVIGHHCNIGAHCIIQSHVTIGSDGYGFAQDTKGISYKIPQLGIVRIEDHVEIGANCAIDRATFDETIIGEGTKMDNLCHVAHNSQIGKHCLITAGFFVAGSSRIGNHLITGGQVSINGHIEICDNVQLAGKSVVMKNITQPGTYGGDPLEPIKDYLRTKQNFKHLTDMRKKIHQLTK